MGGYNGKDPKYAPTTFGGHKRKRSQKRRSVFWVFPIIAHPRYRKHIGDNFVLGTIMGKALYSIQLQVLRMEKKRGISIIYSVINDT